MEVFVYVKQYTVTIANRIFLAKRLPYGVFHGSILAPTLVVPYAQRFPNLIKQDSYGYPTLADHNNI